MKMWIFPMGQARSSDGVPYADIYARAIAATIDLALLFTVFKHWFFLLSQRLYRGVDYGLLQQAQGMENPQQMLLLAWQSGAVPLWLINAGLQLGMIGVVFVGAQCMWYTTPGKWLLGLRIVDAKTMERPARWRFVVRYMAYAIAAAPLMIGIVWATFSKRRRGWHDYIAGTAVIHTRGWVWYKEKALRIYRWLRANMRQS